MSVKVLVENVAENRDKFKELRKGKLGGSDIAAAAGLNPWCSPFELFLKFTGEQQEKAEESDNLWFGRAVEPALAGLFERRKGIALTPVNSTFYNDLWPDFIASPDFEGLVDGSPALVETKFSGFGAKGKWSDTEAPDSAHCQLIWQMGLLEKYKTGFCAGFLGSVRDFYTPEFQFDPELFKRLVEIGEDFLHLCKKGEAPTMRADDLQKVHKWLGLREGFAPVSTEILPTLMHHWELKAKLKAANAEVKAIEESKKKLEAEIALAMKGHRFAECEGFTLERKLVPRKGFVVNPTSYYTLTTKKIEGGE